jgi:hypothetical protein
LLRLAEAFGRDVSQARVLIRQRCLRVILLQWHCPRKCKPGAPRLVSRSLVSRLADYYCLENNAAFKREAEPSAAKILFQRPVFAIARKR